MKTVTLKIIPFAGSVEGLEEDIDLDMKECAKQTHIIYFNMWERTGEECHLKKAEEALVIYKKAA